MNYKKIKKVRVISLVLIAVLSLSTIIVGAIPLLKKASDKEVVNQKVSVQEKQEISSEKTISNGGLAKYMTLSQKGNIDIGVNYLNPISGDTDTLMFDVTLGTHSVDLSEYEDIRKFVVLVTEDGNEITEGFEWDLKNNESHHINGVLKIKNSIDGENAIVRSDTKLFTLVFKNIGQDGERKHRYEGDKLS